MATTAEGVCNIALLRLGQRDTIASLGEQSAQARACNALFETARDAVLQLAIWGFATKRALLAALTGEERSGWTYAYALPTDCIAPRLIWPGDWPVAPDARIPYAEESTGTARLILTNQPDAELVYTARITAVPLFSPLFQQALAWYLAADLALALPVKPGLAAQMQQGFRLALSQAQAANFNQQQESPPPDADAIRARR